MPVLSRRVPVPAVAAAAMLWSSSALAQVQPAAGTSWVRCEYARGDDPTVRGGVVFPDGDVFRPLLAAPKEPRNSFTFRDVTIRDGRPSGIPDVPSMNVGSVSAGGVVGLWAHKLSACRGVQLNLVGGLFSEFNLDASSRDLINTDFVVGLQLSFRRADYSGRLRVYHQSSHLGDEFVRRNPAAGDLNFGFQGVDGLISIDREQLRAYGGGGYLVFMNGNQGSVALYLGGEYRARRRVAASLRPLVAVDLASLQARSWGLTLAVSAGVEFTSPEASRRMRALFVLIDGYAPFGQFALEQKARSLGIQLQIEF